MQNTHTLTCPGMDVSRGGITPKGMGARMNGMGGMDEELTASAGVVKNGIGFNVDGIFYSIFC